MRRLGARGKYPGAHVGSLLDDVGAIARKIHATLIDDDVVVWSGVADTLYFTHQRTAPELPADCVLGTYRMGASAADIEEDLLELRRCRVSGSMIG
jgi:hypothetical protein